MMPRTHALPVIYRIIDKAALSGRCPVKLIQNTHEHAIEMIRLRRGAQNPADYLAWISLLVPLAQQQGIRVLVDSEVNWLVRTQADGLHLRSCDLPAYQQKPQTAIYVAASVHDPIQIAQANQLAVDFVTLSPVKKTASHPGKPALGWQKFFELAQKARMPVYALGGMSQGDLATAQAHGGYGIAGIRQL